MPVIIPKGLPAEEELRRERIFTMSEARAISQDIRPLKIAIVNLMPLKEVTELQLLRRLSNTPLQIDIDLIKTESYQSKNTDHLHLEKFYKTFSEIKNDPYDAFIITGAPVENMEFEEVAYWEELTSIFDYVKEHVFSTMFICWAAQAALYYYYGIPKCSRKEKILGVYEYELLKSTALAKGFDDKFYVPQSRFTYNRAEDLTKVDKLHVLAADDETGVHLAATEDHRLVFVSGHWEYDHDTLHLEYLRDQAKGKPTQPPLNYYENGDPNGPIRSNWRAHGNLFFANWLNYCVYQETPYDITKIVGWGSM